jgi:flagella basal body P-ring formation protein FlgA
VVFAPIADLILARFDGKTPFRSITAEEIRELLHDAGVNLAVIKFAGATACTISRSDVQYDEREALQQWIEARQATTRPGSKAAAEDFVKAVAPQTQPASTQKVEPNPYRTLGQSLAEDLAVRLALPVEGLQMQFNPADEKVLNLSEPYFRFNVAARRARNLGDVAWDVQIVTAAGTQKVHIAAGARAWQQQVVVMKPLAYKQIIRDEDVLVRRTLVDRLSDDPLLSISQVVGQEAAVELKPGTMFTARTVNAVPLAKTGQLVTVSLRQGAVQLRTAARAMESGTYGQSIRVRNEATKDIYQVTMIGPQLATMGSLEAR